MSNPSYGLGWLPDLPDARDVVYSLTRAPSEVPPRVDLRPKCPPVYDQGALGSCHDSETDVLTERGWKRFSALDGSERLATVNPSTFELIFERPMRLVRFPYSGPMICARNQSLDFRVTPDHKMLVRKWNEAKHRLQSSYTLVPAKELGWYVGLLNRVEWIGENSSLTYILPGVDHKHKPQRNPRAVPMVAWVRFLGLYLAEGTMLKKDQRAGYVYKVQIAASKEREKIFAREVFQQIGVNALELADRFTFENRQVYEAMESIGLLGVKAGEKFVPSFIFSLPASMIAEFLAGHFAGDGSVDAGGVRAHYTGSSQLADDLQCLIFLSGNETRLSIREARSSMTADGRTIIGNLPEHRISVCERKNLSIERSHTIFEEHYEGDVFCAEVPTHHTLVTRRNGKILVSGNCTGNAIAAAVEFDRMRQGLQVFVPSRLFVYYNERAMEGTVASDSGAMIRDGIKSVNQVGAPPETEWPYDVAKFAVKPSPAAYAAALGDTALQYARIGGGDLVSMKDRLASGLPFVFGFTVYRSFMSAEVAGSGVAEMPRPGESVVGGHAVMAVGYDDQAARFIVRNSWGVDWGMSGYFTMPYRYVDNPDLTDDFWSINVVGPKT